MKGSRQTSTKGRRGQNRHSQRRNGHVLSRMTRIQRSASVNRIPILSRSTTRTSSSWRFHRSRRHQCTRRRLFTPKDSRSRSASSNRAVWKIVQRRHVNSTRKGWRKHTIVNRDYQVRRCTSRSTRRMRSSRRRTPILPWVSTSSTKVVFAPQQVNRNISGRPLWRVGDQVNSSNQRWVSPRTSRASLSEWGSSTNTSNRTSARGGPTPIHAIRLSNFFPLYVYRTHLPNRYY